MTQHNPEVLRLIDEAFQRHKATGKKEDFEVFLELLSTPTGRTILESVAPSLRAMEEEPN